MRWNFALACVLVTLSFVDCGSRAESSEWTWGKGRDRSPDGKTTAAALDTSSSIQIVNVTSDVEADESLIESIVSSSRQGRTLEQDGFNQVASDPQVRQALEAGNDSEARHFIREKLCNLGLMTCEPGIEPKRPYVQPHDLIYAQPVHIKPVGRPIPAVPVRGPPLHSLSGYGPPKPIPFPPGPGPFIPPHRPPRPLPGPIYGAPKPLPPPVYETVEPDLHNYHPHPVLKKPVEVVVNSQGGVQQHVHHHYHHGDGGVVKPTVVVDQPGPLVPTGPVFEPGPVYGSTSLGIGGGTIGSGSLYSSGPIGGDVYGGNGPYLGHSPFYKKELSVKAPLTGNGLASTASSTNYADRYPSYENPRADGIRGLGDCVCVPYDQCLPHEVTRKEDGFYIDPRTNGGTNIEAITLDDVVITDGNGSIISRHAKRQNDGGDEFVVEGTLDEERKNDEKEEESTTGAAVTEDKLSEEKNNQRKRREISVNEDNNEKESKKSDVQPRLFGDASKYKLSPTFGVSFGLPYGGGGGGYPLNPYGPHPALNPYGGSVGGSGGVNLGLVSVNPLLSVQVTQDEYGDKIVKPLVNLHVTPNHGLVHKIGSLLHGLHHKPHYPVYPPYKHDHHHHHIHMSKPYPPYYYPHKPSYHYGGHYAPGYYGYRTKNEFTGTGNGYYSSGYASGDVDEYDNGDDYVDDPYASYSRRSRGNQTANVPSSTSSSSSGIGTSRKVQFPSDRRRGVGSRTRRQADNDRDGQNEVIPVQEVRQQVPKRPVKPATKQDHMKCLLLSRGS